MPTKKLADRFAQEDSARATILDRARKFAAIVGKSYILPPLGQNPGDDLPNPNSSKASRGISNLVGKLMPALWPGNGPFFDLDLKPELRFRIDPAKYQAYRTKLYLHALQIMAMLESAPLLARDNAPSRSFRLSKRSVIEQALICGDVLECLTPDYRVRKFRMDQYVTRRDCSGAVEFHIVCEKINPRRLTPEQLAKTEIDLEEFDKGDREHIENYTLYEYQPQTRKWLLRQECNGNVYNEGEHVAPRFFATPWELTEGEHYGHGFVELHRGDIFAYDELTGRMLDYAGNASKVLWGIDAASNMRPDDMQLTSGSVIEGLNVKGGAVHDIAAIKVDKMSDMSVVGSVYQRLDAELSKAFLLDMDSAPTGEAGRHATAWKVMLNQINGMLGDSYAAIDDEQARPLVFAVMDQMKQDKLIDPQLPDIVQISSTTGMEAVNRQQKLASVMDFASTVAQFAQFDPGIIKRIDFGTFVDIAARLHQVDEPGLVRTQDQVNQEAAQQQSAAAKSQLVEQLIKSGGAIAENAAANAA